MMKIVLALVLLVAIAAAAPQGPRWHELSVKYTFEKYLGDFGKTYDKKSGEYWMRKDNFEQRLASILEHNADKSQSYKRGINQFSDWTAQEWKNYNQATPDKRPQSVNLPVVQYNGTGRTIFPKTVDYRTATNPPRITAIKNQGHCGSCWAHSATETIESRFAALTGQLPVLSQGQINSCTTSMFGCGGGSYVSAWEYVANSSGLNEEWAYPYTDFWCKEMNKAGTSSCKNITKEFLPGWSWYPKANVTGINVVKTNDAQATMEALAVYGPVSIAVGAGDWSDYEEGIFHNIPNSTATYQIDHAVQLVGFGYDFDVNENFWIVRNSWGTTWGEDGFIRLYRPAKEPCGEDQGQKVCGTSGMLFEPAFPDVAPLKKLNV